MRTRLLLVSALCLLLLAGLMTGCSKGEYVGSSITKTYHTTTCVWAEQLDGTDRAVWFETAEQAEGAGFTPCGSCLDGE